MGGVSPDHARDNGEAGECFELQAKGSGWWLPAARARCLLVRLQLPGGKPLGL